jgi:hypothetical protein
VDGRRHPESGQGEGEATQELGGTGLPAQRQESPRGRQEESLVLCGDQSSRNRHDEALGHMIVSHKRRSWGRGWRERLRERREGGA